MLAYIDRCYKTIKSQWQKLYLWILISVCFPAGRRKKQNKRKLVFPQTGRAENTVILVQTQRPAVFKNKARALLSESPDHDPTSQQHAAARLFIKASIILTTPWHLWLTYRALSGTMNRKIYLESSLKPLKKLTLLFK